MSEAKYICGELPAAVGTCYGAVVFPDFMSHAEVARRLGIKASSAGFCNKDALGQWVAYGKSTSLKLQSMPDDSRQLNKLCDAMTDYERGLADGLREAAGAVVMTGNWQEAEKQGMWISACYWLRMYTAEILKGQR